VLLPIEKEMRFSALGLLATGTLINVVAQVISDKAFLDPTAHILPLVKYASSLLFAAVSRLGSKGQWRRHTSEQQAMMLLMGTLDAAAYTAFSMGFTLCGAAVSALVLAGCTQVCNALAARYLLHKHHTSLQVIGIGCVCSGLLIRAAPADMHAALLLYSYTPRAAFLAFQSPQSLGVALVVVAAVLYSAMGLAYEYLVSCSAGLPPSHAEIMWNTSLLGKGSIGCGYNDNCDAGLRGGLLLFEAPRFSHARCGLLHTLSACRIYCICRLPGGSGAATVGSAAAAGWGAGCGLGPSCWAPHIVWSFLQRPQLGAGDSLDALPPN
jgi:drug/metabolite transporter (DMT)-like permease